MTPQQLATAAGCRIERAGKWLPAIEAAMSRYHIESPMVQAAFIAQVAHESARLSSLEEGLNYSQAGLLATFGKRFTSSEAFQYARQPQRIANRVYANRMGNGPEDSGDGWKYRGRGLLQLTGKDNYRKGEEALGLPLLDDPDLLFEMKNAADSAAWIFWRSGAIPLAEAGDFDGVSDVINLGRKTAKEGDSVGYADRLALYRGAVKALLV